MHVLFVEPAFPQNQRDFVRGLHQAGADRPKVICGQGVAPQAATIEAYRALDLKLVPGTGMLAAVVPGAFDAWMLLLRDYGTKTLRDVLEPAIFYAEAGF